MNMRTTPDKTKHNTAPRDYDLQRMAKSGYGVPSQDLDAGAQQPLDEHERLRELRSSFSAGGLLGGLALGGAVGMLLAGPLGVALGCVTGAVAGAYGGLSMGRSLIPNPEQDVARALPLAD